MESLNHTFFLWLNAPEHPSALALTLATFLAEQLIWAVPLLIGIGWLRGGEDVSPRELTAITKRAYIALAERGQLLYPGDIERCRRSRERHERAEWE